MWQPLAIEQDRYFIAVFFQVVWRQEIIGITTLRYSLVTNNSWLALIRNLINRFSCLILRLGHILRLNIRETISLEVRNHIFLLTHHGVENQVLIGYRIVVAKSNILKQDIRAEGHGEGIWIFIDQVSAVFVDLLCKGFRNVLSGGQTSKILPFWVFCGFSWIVVLDVHVITYPIEGICQKSPVGILGRGIDTIVSHIGKMVHGGPLQARTKGAQARIIQKGRRGS